MGYQIPINIYHHIIYNIYVQYYVVCSPIYNIVWTNCFFLYDRRVMTGLCHAFHRSYVGSAVLHSPTVVLTEDKASVIRSVMILSNNKDCDDDDDGGWWWRWPWPWRLIPLLWSLPVLRHVWIGAQRSHGPNANLWHFPSGPRSETPRQLPQKKCPTSKNQPPKLHLLLIFKFSDVFRICPIFINLQLSQTSKFFPQLHLPTAGITSTGSFSTSEEKLCTATGHVAEKSNVCRDGDAASVESWFGWSMVIPNALCRKTRIVFSFF